MSFVGNENIIRTTRQIIIFQFIQERYSLFELGEFQAYLSVIFQTTKGAPLGLSYKVNIY